MFTFSQNFTPLVTSTTIQFVTKGTLQLLLQTPYTVALTGPY